MARKKTLAIAEAQYSRIKTALAARTPNPSIGLGSLSNMGGPNGVIANRYARATNGLMKIKMASKAKKERFDRYIKRHQSHVVKTEKGLVST